MDRWQHCLLAGQWLRIQGVMLCVEFVRYWFAILLEGVTVSKLSYIEEANGWVTALDARGLIQN